MPKKRYFSRILYKNCASFCLSLSLSLSLFKTNRTEGRAAETTLGCKGDAREAVLLLASTSSSSVSKKERAIGRIRFSNNDFAFPRKIGSRGGEEKTMTEDRNQTLADALEELGFRGHVPKQWVPMVAEVRRARLLSILRPGGVAVFRGVFWILDFCTEARRLERRVSFFENREEAKDRERRTSRGARKIFHDDGRNRAFSSLSTTF